MHILQIEHPVPSYEGWKKAFDRDPINRKQSGVRRYKISRKIDDPNYVIIDLEFDNLNDAEACLLHGRCPHRPTSQTGKEMVGEDTNQ